MKAACPGRQAGCVPEPSTPTFISFLFPATLITSHSRRGHVPTLLREQPHPIQPLRDSQPRVRFPPREDSALQSVTRAMTWEAQRKSVPDGTAPTKTWKLEAALERIRSGRRGDGDGRRARALTWRGLRSHYTWSVAVLLLGSLPLAWGLPRLINFVSPALAGALTPPNPHLLLSYPHLECRLRGQGE